MDAYQSLFFLPFGQIDGPRLERKNRHSLIDVIAITVCPVIAGADGCTHVEEFGRA